MVIYYARLFIERMKHELEAWGSNPEEARSRLQDALRVHVGQDLSIPDPEDWLQRHFEYIVVREVDTSVSYRDAEPLTTTYAFDRLRQLPGAVSATIPEYIADGPGYAGPIHLVAVAAPADVAGVHIALPARSGTQYAYLPMAPEVMAPRIVRPADMLPVVHEVMLASTWYCLGEAWRDYLESPQALRDSGRVAVFDGPAGSLVVLFGGEPGFVSLVTVGADGIKDTFFDIGEKGRGQGPTWDVLPVTPKPGSPDVAPKATDGQGPCSGTLI